MATKQNRKHTLLITLLIVAILATFAACGSKDDSDEAEEETTTRKSYASIYEDSEIKDITSEDDTVIGHYAVCEAKSSDITVEVLEDWYYSFVTNEDNDLTYAVILFTDKEGEGALAMFGAVYPDAKLDVDNDYILDVTAYSDLEYYVPMDDKLISSDEAEADVANTGDTSDLDVEEDEVVED